MKAHQVVSTLLCVFLVCFAGCIGVDSKHPLSDPSKAAPDERLNGRWVQLADKITIEYSVVSAGEGAPKGMHKLTMKIDEDVATTYCFATQLGKHRYLNLANFDTDDPPPKWDASKVTYYSILGYQFVNEDEFQVLPMDKKFFESLIEKGELSKREIGEDFDDFIKDIENPNNVEPPSLPESALNSDTATLAAVFTKYADTIRSKKPMTIKKRS